ncbi:cytidine deaminase-like protein [Meredithblackwellia eburnea MCA 4105]
MTSNTAAQLLNTFLDTTEKDIFPLTHAGVSSGSKVFGAAIFKKDGLEQVMVGTNKETASPLLHGEVSCLQSFWGLEQSSRPLTKDCVFFATHEPCSLCLSAITWSGFDNHYFLFTYEDTRDMFSIPYDIQINKEVFSVRGEGESEESYAKKPLYNKKNAFWTAKSIQDLLDELPEGEEKAALVAKTAKVKGLYGALSDTYQSTKGTAGIPLA